MSGDSSRKPSGSSTHSGTHSPPGASGNSRKLPSGSASNLYGMGGGNGGNGLKALNTGWQVWGSSTAPSSKRNASMSSLASVAPGEMSGDTNLRSNAAEPWSARSASGTWDDTALKKDFSSLDPQPQLNLRQTRQRQSHAGGFPPSRTDERSSGSKNHHVNLGKDSTAPRYSSTKPLGAGSYPGQPPSFPLPTLGYDSVATENDLTLAMRGMTVEDDFNALHARQQAQSSIPGQVHSQMRGTSTLQQQRNVYSTYPTAEYGFYPPGRDTFVDYPYVGYGTPDPSFYGSSGVPMSPGLYPSVPQSLHPNTVAIRQQPAVYFDYNAPTRPPSQFFFPQTMMYPPPHSPMLSSQLPVSSAPVTLTEKKHEITICSNSWLPVVSCSGRERHLTPKLMLQH
ncbi:hypothetical protein FB451DRAFT_739901 [Mycena latifolia]|nr:hypothetical protein FB451DRAFT_739901 [Mycena latifolia]